MSILEEIQAKEEELRLLYFDYKSETESCNNIDCGFYKPHAEMHCTWTTLVTTCNKYIAE